LRKTVLSLAAAFAIALAYPLAAAANCGDTYTIYNEGSHTIYQVFVEPHNYAYWGPDLLGSSDVLEPGYHFQPLSFYYGANPNIPDAYQDIKVVYGDGHVITDYDVNICEYNTSFYY
jgi:hypothetical protein